MLAVKLHGFVNTGSQLTISPGPMVRTLSRFNLYDAVHSEKESENGSVEGTLGKIRCNAVASVTKCIMELMCSMPAFLCPIGVSGVSHLQRLLHIEQ